MTSGPGQSPLHYIAQDALTGVPFNGQHHQGSILENNWSVLRQCLHREFSRVEGVYELAMVLRGGGIITGYADNPDTAERLIREAHKPGLHQGVYIGINPLAAPPPGRTLGEPIGVGKRAETAIVPRRRRLFFDIDPERVGAKGADMATDTERACAAAFRETVEEFLSGLGWPKPAQRGSSGNGEFLVYLIDEPNDADTDQLLEHVLHGVAKATTDIPGAHIDTGVHDAPRIMKVPGTVVAKNASAGRPWRLADEGALPPSPLVTREMLHLAALYARHDPAPEALDETVQGAKKALAARGVGLRREVAKYGGVLLDLDTCLIAEEPHADGGTCGVHIRPTGLSIFCLADRCRDRTLRGAEAYARLGLEPPELVPGGSDGDPRPWIPAGVMDVTKLRPKTWQAVNALNEREPSLLRQGRYLVRTKWPQSGGAPELSRVAEKNDLPSLLQDAARWYVIEKPKRGQPIGPKIRKDARPPDHVLIDVLKELDPPVSRLDYVLTAPAILPGGVLLAETGYFPEHGIAVAIPPELGGLSVPERPTQEQSARALAFLRDLLTDFPFTTGWDEANAIGLMLTPFLRPAINNTVPPFMILANRQGAGKTNLGRALLRPAMGDTEFYMAYDPSEEERKKSLATLFRDGKSVFGWDNVTGTFKSPTLAAIVTTKNLQLRILGSPEQAVVPTGVIPVLTGNNVQFDADMRERMARIQINVEMQRPSDRPLDSFTYPNVWDVILKRRKEVVEAVLTMALGWWTAGQPTPAWIAPRNTGWSTHIHGAFEAAGWLATTPDGRGYSQGFAEVREADELDDQAQRIFVDAWWAIHGGEPVAPKELVDLAYDAGIEFGKDRTDPATRLKGLSQSVLPQLDGVVYGIRDELEVKARRTKGKKRGVRTLWELTLLGGDGAKSAAPTTPAAPSGGVGTEKNTEDTPPLKKSLIGSLEGAAGAAGAAPSASSSFTDMTEGAM